MPNTLDIIPFLTVIGSLAAFALYLHVGLRPENRSRGLRSFLFADKSITGLEYTTASAAYGIRVFVVGWFIYLGYCLQLGVIYYILSWFVGMQLFRLCAPALWRFAKSDRSIYSHLCGDDRHCRSLQIVASMCTLAGLSAVIFIDLDLTSTAISWLMLKTCAGSAMSAAGSAAINVGSPLLSSCLLAYLLAFLLWYVYHGGIKAAIRTDFVQLPIALASFELGVIALVLSSSDGTQASGASVVLVAFVLLNGVIVVSRLRWRSLGSAYADWTLRIALASAGVGVFFLGTTFLGALSCDDWHSLLRSAQAMLARPFVDANNSVDILGAVNILGFLVLNLCWQFVDLTAWQRIQTIAEPLGSDNDRVVHLRQCLSAASWESAAVWALSALIGVALYYSPFAVTIGASSQILDFYVGVRECFLGTGVANQQWGAAVILLLPLGVVSLVSLAISTADSCACAIAYTIHDDMLGTRVTDRETRHVRLQLVGWAFTLLACHWLLTHLNAHDMTNYLLLMYSCQLALLPVMLRLLLSRQPVPRHTGTCSILAGIAATFLVGALTLHCTQWVAHRINALLIFFGSERAIGPGIDWLKETSSTFAVLACLVSAVVSYSACSVCKMALGWCRQ